jgi:large subunit ribosomal protein L20
MRRLWIVRINAAARANGLSYSTFMAGLNKAQVAVDRKMLAEMAVNDAATFKGLVDVARSAMSGQQPAAG